MLSLFLVSMNFCMFLLIIWREKKCKICLNKWEKTSKTRQKIHYGITGTDVKYGGWKTLTLGQGNVFKVKSHWHFSAETCYQSILDRLLWWQCNGTLVCFGHISYGTNTFTSILINRYWNPMEYTMSLSHFSQDQYSNGGGREYFVENHKHLVTNLTKVISPT